MKASDINGKPASRQALRVGLLPVEIFTLNAFSGFVDALRLAADRGARSRQIRCAWTIMGRGPVTASCGLRIEPGSALCPPSSFDYIAVCGGNGYTERSQPDWLTGYLRDAAEAGTRLIGICTGTFNLARAGLMDGFPACVHWNVLDEFRDQFPTVEARPDCIFLDAGARITCAGSTGATDLALHLIARHCGHEFAQQAIRHLMLHSIRPAGAAQAHFYSDLGHVRDERVRRAATLMEQSLNQPLQIPDIAAHVDVSPRQLERRFHAALGVGPAAFYRDLRLRYGAFMLRHTTESVMRIALDAGFADGAHFTRAFKERFGAVPSSYRHGIASARELQGPPASDATGASSPVSTSAIP